MFQELCARKEMKAEYIVLIVNPNSSEGYLAGDEDSLLHQTLDKL